MTVARRWSWGWKLAALLVLPLTILLCVQWPLREWIQSGSRLANDSAQILFALYVAVAVSAATRSGAHLATRHGPEHALRPWRRRAAALCVVPWAIGTLWVAAPQVWQALLLLEKFPDTLNPGYFMIRVALAVLMLLVLAQALAALLGRRNP